MGFQTLEILRQGVWASLTGGWFYDPHHNIFCNTFHFYLWMFLVLLPFLVHLWSYSTWYPWAAYTGVILIAFTALKVINLKLHLMFDTSESIEEQTLDKHSQRKDTQPCSDVEDIELQVLGTKEADEGTPPADCNSSRNSDLEHSALTVSVVGNAPHKLEAAGDSTEQQQLCDVTVDVHRKSSSASCDQALVAIDMLSHKLDRSNASCSSKNQIQFSDELFLCRTDDSLSPVALTSLKSVNSEEAETATGRQICLRTVSGSGSGRRFSNLSNLAFDLSSTTTSAPRLQGGGSLELGFVLEDGAANQKSANPRPALSSVRRTLSALETSSASPSSAHPASTSSAPQ